MQRYKWASLGPLSTGWRAASWSVSVSGFAHVGGMLCGPVCVAGYYVCGKNSRKEQWIWERIENRGQGCFKKEEALKPQLRAGP